MPIEPIDPTAIRIPELDPLSPGSDELLGEGDDHMRIVKSAVTNSFPSIGIGSCALRAEQINQNYAAVNKVCGMIVWWGEDDITPLPEGWAPCDGGVYNGITTPIIASMFLKHGNAGEVQGSLGGKKDQTEGLLAHPLGSNEVPAHNHTFTANLGGPNQDGAEQNDYNEGAGGGPTSFTIDTKGGNQSHEHPFTYDNQPPYYTLQAITYVGVV